jgi:hypothetical protein
MSKPFQFGLGSRLAPPVIVSGVLLAICGCGRGIDKVEQIRRGVENVDHHAKEIQRKVHSPAQQPATQP